MKKCNNEGMTLVEIIIVIAIMAVLVGMFFSSTNYIGVSQARALANSIKTCVGQARIQTMGKYETYLYIYKSKNDGHYYKEFWKKYDEEHGMVRDKREMIGKNRPTVNYYVKGDPTAHQIVTGSGLLIKFNRSSGKEESKAMPSGTTYTDEEGTAVSPTTSVLCEKITVSYGTREYEVKIVPETGKISLGNEDE